MVKKKEKTGRGCRRKPNCLRSFGRSSRQKRNEDLRLCAPTTKLATSERCSAISLRWLRRKRRKITRPLCLLFILIHCSHANYCSPTASCVGVVTPCLSK